MTKAFLIKGLGKDQVDVSDTVPFFLQALGDFCSCDSNRSQAEYG